MLQRVLAGDKCIGYYTMRYDGGEFYVNPDFLVNTSDYFVSLCSFQSEVNQVDRVIDMQHIRKKRMIDVSV
jgi:hypothetical protein